MIALWIGIYVLGVVISLISLGAMLGKQETRLAEQLIPLALLWPIMLPLISFLTIASLLIRAGTRLRK